MRVPPVVRFAVLVGAWVLIALFFAGQYYVAAVQMGHKIPFSKALYPELICWFLWALTAPVALFLAHRYPIDRDRWAGRALFHGAAAVVFSGVHTAAETALFLAFGIFDRTPPFLIGVERLLVRELHLDVLTYAVLLGIAHALDYTRRERARELAGTRLEARLAEAELRVLRTQLQPHFLFNTLHAISALMHKDVEMADRMMTRLGDLLRHSLDSGGRQEVPLREELEFLERYLEIQRTRFEDRMVVRLSVDPDTLDARVPNLILQPLVENAVQHGIAPRCGSGRIEIRSQRVDRTLELQVVDDGAGPRDGPGSIRLGHGLANTRARLLQLYGPMQSFNIRRGETGGMAVTLSIPFRMSQEDKGGDLG